jgi:DNA-binding CsgD family transcriptional regulator
MNNKINRFENPIFMNYRYVFRGFETSLENDYKKSIYDSILKLSRFTIMMALFLVALCGILDVWMLPSSKIYSWIIRFAIICYAIFCFIISYFNCFKRIGYVLLCIFSFITAFGISLMIALAQKESDKAFFQYFAGLILVVIALNTGGCMRFIYSLPVNFLILINYDIVAVFSNKMLSSADGIVILLSNNFFLISSQILSLIACFFMEYYLRESFLLKRRIIKEEEENKKRSMSIWMEAYRIYKQIDSELILNNIGKSFENKDITAKNEQITSGVLNLIKNIISNNNLSGIFKKVADMSMEIGGVNKCCIVIKKDESYEITASSNLNEKLQQKVLKAAMQAFNHDDDDILDDGINDFENENSTVIFHILEYESKPIGAFYIEGKSDGSILNVEKIEMIRFLITQVIISLGDRLWKQEDSGINIDESFVISEADKFNLTRSEKEILLFVVKGFSNKEICDENGISKNTLRTHLKNIYIKTDISNRNGLLIKFSKFKSG